MRAAGQRVARRRQRFRQGDDCHTPLGRIGQPNDLTSPFLLLLAIVARRRAAVGGHRRADVLTRTQRLAGGEGATRTLRLSSAVDCPLAKAPLLSARAVALKRADAAHALATAAAPLRRFSTPNGLCRSDQNPSERAMAPSWLLGGGTLIAKPLKNKRILVETAKTVPGGPTQKNNKKHRGHFHQRPSSIYHAFPFSIERSRPPAADQNARRKHSYRHVTLPHGCILMLLSVGRSPSGRVPVCLSKKPLPKAR